MEEKTKILVECVFCGHRWNYKGKMFYSVCPCCMKKTKTGLDKK